MASSPHYEPSKWALVPYVHKAFVPCVQKPQMTNSKDIHLKRKQSPVVIFLVKATFSRTKSRTTNGTEGVPDELSLKLPRGFYQDIFITDELTKEGSARNESWSKPINFRLPEDSVRRILKSDEEAQATCGADRLSLFERLDGWEIQKRKRENSERFDKYFYHKKSKGRFRSFVEVKTFITLGRFPQQQQPKNEKVREGSSASWTTPEASNGIAKRRKISVEKFLEDAWNNLLNQDSTSGTKKKKDDRNMKATNDSDEETNQMISELMEKEDQNPQKLAPPQENGADRGHGKQGIEGGSSGSPLIQNGGAVYEGRQIFFAGLAFYEEYRRHEEENGTKLRRI